MGKVEEQLRGVLQEADPTEPAPPPPSTLCPSRPEVLGGTRDSVGT